VRWRCRDRLFEIGTRPLVMGVVNVTPDSFSDGGRFLDPAAAIDQARRLIDEGADLVDVGAESTRPGAEPVAPDRQWRRLEPVLERLATLPGACVSVDTSSAVVAELALGAGARIINDVTALRDPGMAGAVAASGAGVVLMHMRGTPADMQREPRYDDVSVEVTEWLGGRLDAARALGIREECIALDPGIGFGKTPAHNLELIARLDRLAALDRPIVIGASRKSFIGRLLDLPVEERLEGGLAAAAVAVFQGATVIRTHDVAATVRAITIAGALRAARAEEAAARVGGPGAI
jgi:dihydropteroate synthase